MNTSFIETGKLFNQVKSTSDLNDDFFKSEKEKLNILRQNIRKDNAELLNIKRKVTFTQFFNRPSISKD